MEEDGSLQLLVILVLGPQACKTSNKEAAIKTLFMLMDFVRSKFKDKRTKAFKI